MAATWNATEYACAGEALMPIPTGFVAFQVKITGSVNNWTGQFTQTNGGGACVSTNTSPVTCDGTLGGVPALITEPSTPEQCTPSNCLKSGCGAVPAPLEMSYSVTGTGTNRVLTTVTPTTTPLTTCTSQGKSNPITFTWSPG